MKNYPILIKFGTLQQILNPMTVTWPEIEVLKFKMAAAAILKIAFLAITHRPIVRFQRYFVWGSRTACRQGLDDKNCKFLKFKMADGRHFEDRHITIISVKILLDFDKIWCTTACIGPEEVFKSWKVLSQNLRCDKVTINE